MNIKYLGGGKELLDAAFGSARRNAGKEKSMRIAFKTAKLREQKRVQTAGNLLIDRLEKTVTDFPNMNELHPFYRELIGAIIDIDELKKALAHMMVTAKIIRKFKGEYGSRIGRVGATNGNARVTKFRIQFYGRASSAVKKLEKSLKIYDNARRRMREIPAVKFDVPTVILAGYPNTGKTTLLKRLTASSPKIAAYPFTTQSIMVGYFTRKYVKMQVVDTPGLLDRPLEKRNNVELKAVAALKHLGDLVVFVIDPTEHCGFEIERQVNLLREIEKMFKMPIVVAINKTDIAKEGQIESVKKKLGAKLGKNAVLDGETKDNGAELADEISKLLGKARKVEDVGAMGAGSAGKRRK